MPVFDRSASRPGRAEADLLRSVLGPAKPRSTSLRLYSRDYRRRQARATVTRALVVLTLLGCFFGSAVVMSENRRSRPGAVPVLPSGAAQAPVRAHAYVWPALPALRCSNEMPDRLPSETPGEALTPKRLVAETDTN
jgi:hypothetical protein